MKKEKTGIRQQNELFYIDICAAVCFVLYAVWFIVCMHRGISSIDESFYYTIPHRLLKGDAMFTDEWHVSQLSAVLQLFPLWAFYKLKGSLTGFILFMRYVYAACQLIFYGYIYLNFRKAGMRKAGLIGAVLFCGFIPNVTPTLNYYTMSIMASVIVCVELFVRKKYDPLRLVFVGFVFACAVLAEPVLAVMWFIYSLLVLICFSAQKRGKQYFSGLEEILSARTWRSLLIGIVICAVPFFVFVFSRAGLSEIIAELPNLLFTDSEYIFGRGGFNIFDTARAGGIVGFFGGVYIVLAAVLLGLTLLFAKKKAQYRHGLLIASCLLFICVLIRASLTGAQGDVMSYVSGISAPLLVFGFECFLLCENKTPELAAFWIYGAVFSVLIDTSSCIVLGIGGVLSAMPAALFSGNLFDELIKDMNVVKNARKPGNKKEKKLAGSLKKLSASALAAAFIAAGIYSGIYLYAETHYHNSETFLAVYDKGECDTVIPDGPLKGIKTTAGICAKMEDIMSDLDGIKDIGGEENVYIADLSSWYYLYLDLPYGIYNTWYVPADLDTRPTIYWRAHPDKRPGVVYVPFYDSYSFYKNEEFIEKNLDYIKSVCDCTVTEGKAGYTVRVNGWKI